MGDAIGVHRFPFILKSESNGQRWREERIRNTMCGRTIGVYTFCFSYKLAYYFLSVTNVGCMTHTLLAPRCAILILLSTTDCRPGIKHKDFQHAPAMRAELVRRLDKMPGLCLTLDKGAAHTLRQCAFVLAALTERMDAATSHILAIKAGFLMECIHC